MHAIGSTFWLSLTEPDSPGLLTAKISVYYNRISLVIFFNIIIKTLGIYDFVITKAISKFKQGYLFIKAVLLG